MSNSLSSFNVLNDMLLRIPRKRVIQLGSNSDNPETVPLVLVAAAQKSSGPGPASISPFHCHSAGGKISSPDSSPLVAFHNVKVQPPTPGHRAANRFPFRENFGFVARSKEASSPPVAGSHTFIPVNASPMSIEPSGEMARAFKERFLLSSAIVRMISPESLFLIWISLSDFNVANHKPSGENHSGEQSKVDRSRPRDKSHILACSSPGG